MSEEVSGQEELVCRRSPSQILNIKSYCVNTLLIVVIVAIYIALKSRYEVPAYSLLLCLIPLILMWWNFMKIRCVKYALTTERLTIISGVLNRTTEEIELYRIKDSGFEEPFIYRLFGLGNVRLETSDKSMESLYIRALPQGRAFREDLRRCVEAIREKKNVREVDFQ